ncbi:TetR/AcrR family transcriptional regulator [Streptomyces sediminimaris]|uniref:TetR/AcrR family transcriptional regulator n=1 Tax=Streptomyces sediminimaris TaxID=3383721 RepID=UPI00399ADDD2
MARWEPNASQRLSEAALELFAERGYENTTVQDIAQRAGLAKSSFFRHFKDKRDVLFGEDALLEPLLAGIAAAPPQAGPLQVMGYALDAVGQEVFISERRSAVARRRTVIDAHPDLQEREGLKSMSLTAALSAAMERRGAPGPLAEVSAQLGILALKMAYERWTEPENTDGFAVVARQAITEVEDAISAVRSRAQ